MIDLACRQDALRALEVAEELVALEAPAQPADADTEPTGWEPEVPWEARVHQQFVQRRRSERGAWAELDRPFPCGRCGALIPAGEVVADYPLNGVVVCADCATGQREMTG